MKLLLTSNGLCNRSIIDALADLLEKRFEKSSIAFIPTAANVEVGDKHWLVNDLDNCRKAGFETIDIVDISALTKDQWRPRLDVADVLLFGGGNTFHLIYWIRKSGLDKLLPHYLKTKIYVGISAGSIIMGKSIFLSHAKKLYYPDFKGTPDERFLELVDFSIRPHLNNKPNFPQVNAKIIGEYAKKLPETIYALDDKSAIKVTDGKIEVITEGSYLIFN
ncbi:MAG: Peptidase S51 dipeptidase E [Candidatus Curtissbacteria bacterium GW2011_GWA1_40_9]|uniref:Peptidase S51 dipeptidase E n=1 Tax=Candidatus Curtissbacteria bacterium GW2011_GWA1_40_9 TaxID=1618408 RepID=A0A0G0TM17_9BACT|nr:MAG: Peptidase S51 dipeptidase E [Candidatus Curtissbacteria bacterium GW2011_GWA1_40_9]